MGKKITLDLFVNDNGCIELPEVERALGLSLLRHPTDPAQSAVSFQFETGRTRKVCELRVPLMGALYWSNILQTMIHDQDLHDLVKRAV